MDEIRFYNTKKETMDNSIQYAGKKRFYVPNKIPILSESLLYKTPSPSFREIAFEISRFFLSDEVDDIDLYALFAEAFPFRVPVFPIDRYTYILDLTYGATGTASDFVARFTTLLALHTGQVSTPLTLVLPGNTVNDLNIARAFAAMKEVRCIFVYPQSAARNFEASSLFSQAKGVVLCCISGTVSDCKMLAYQAASDTSLCNIFRFIDLYTMDTARLIAFTACSVFAALTVLCRAGYDNAIESPRLLMGISLTSEAFFSAALLAKRMLPLLAGFIASTDASVTLPDYVLHKLYDITNVPVTADQIGSCILHDYIRIATLCGNTRLCDDTVLYRLETAQIIDAVNHCNQKTGYIISPDSARIWAAWNAIRNGGINTLKAASQFQSMGLCGDNRFIPHWAKDEEYAKSCITILTQSVHPSLHKHIIKDAIGREPPVPHHLEQLKQIDYKPFHMSSSYEEFKTFLLRNQ